MEEALVILDHSCVTVPSACTLNVIVKIGVKLSAKFEVMAFWLNGAS
jgi:hypothetical protein